MKDDLQITNLQKQESKIYAVLTGDIVGSSKLNSERRIDLYDTFSKISKMLIGHFPHIVSYKMSNFRGDGWQIVVNNPEKALEVSLFIRTFIRLTFQTEKLDTRIAVGIGRILFIPEDNISAGDGPAYFLSGHLLESLKLNRMAVDFENSSSAVLIASVQSIIILVDQIVKSWGSGQCRSVFLAMQGFTQTEIADNWKPNPIKQSSVSKSLKTAGWDAVSQAVESFEMLVSAITKEEPLQ